MKLAILATGILVGFVLADNISAQQRNTVRSLAQRARAGRAAAIGESVGSGLGDIADAAALRVADVVDHATANVAEMVSEPTR